MVALAEELLGDLLFLVEDDAAVAAGLAVVLVLLLELVVGGNDALGDLFELTLAVLGLHVVGVELLDLVEVSAVEVLVSEKVSLLFADACVAGGIPRISRYFLPASRSTNSSLVLMPQRRTSVSVR